MRFLITGIKGFVGPHLAHTLMHDGHKVVGISRSHNIEEDISDTVLGVECVRGDLSYPIFLDFDFDGIFHLASMTHPPTSFNEPDRYFRNNTEAIITLCDYTEVEGTPIMNCSTSEVYGVHPSYHKITEKDPMNPNNPYAVSKAAADLYFLERVKNGYNFGFVTRAFSHTGPRRMPQYSIASDAVQIAKILLNMQEPIIKVGNLDAIRNVMDVRDVADVYAKLMYEYIDNNMSNGEIFNICGDKARKIGDYLDIMLEMFKLKDKVKLKVDKKLFRPIDIPVQVPDSTKVRKFLGWRPSFSIEETLEALVDYWITRLQKPDHVRY